MNWDAIEAISSAISAVGVIATLIYLAYQIRQNTHSLQGATEQSLMTLEKDTYSLAANYAEVMVQGYSDFSLLSPAEAMRFQSIVGAEMSLLYSAHVQYQRKLISPEVWEAYERSTLSNFKEPGFLSAWLEIKSGYPESFCKVMERLENEATNTD
jgi:hypothetical protein